MKSLPKTPTNPGELRAVVDLRRAGWHRREIMALFGWSEATYYRRLAEVRARKPGRPEACFAACPA